MRWNRALTSVMFTGASDVLHELGELAEEREILRRALLELARGRRGLARGFRFHEQAHHVAERAARAQRDRFGQSVQRAGAAEARRFADAIEHVGGVERERVAGGARLGVL